MGPRAERKRVTRVSEGIRYEFAFGSYEDALRMVGVRTAPRYAGTAVSGARIQHFAAMVRDPNPAYWDAEFAREVWGGLVAPPALLMGWLIPPPWLPNNERPVPSIAIRVPLPGTTFINASNEVEFPLTVRVGDRAEVRATMAMTFDLPNGFHLLVVRGGELAHRRAVFDAAPPQHDERGHTDR